MLPQMWIMVLLHFWVDLSVCVIPKRAFQELEGFERLLSPFEGEHLEWTQTSESVAIFPKGKCLGSHVVGWKYPVHLDNPTTIGWTIGGRRSPSECVSRLRPWFQAILSSKETYTVAPSNSYRALQHLPFKSDWWSDCCNGRVEAPLSPSQSYRRVRDATREPGGFSFWRKSLGSLGQERVNILGVVGAELKVSAPLSAHLP